MARKMGKPGNLSRVERHERMDLIAKVGTGETAME